MKHFISSGMLFMVLFCLSLTAKTDVLDVNVCLGGGLDALSGESIAITRQRNHGAVRKKFPGTCITLPNAYDTTNDYPLVVIGKFNAGQTSSGFGSADLYIEVDEYVIGGGKVLLRESDGTRQRMPVSGGDISFSGVNLDNNIRMALRLDVSGDLSFVGPSAKTAYYFDGDGDGYGNPDALFTASFQPDNYITNAGDCDDSNDAINPDATEINDNAIDEDCDGVAGVTIVNKTLFVTSTLQAADFGGLAGGDGICNTRAGLASLPGTYKALLSTSTVDAKDRVVHAVGTDIVNTNGDIISDGTAGLWDGTLDNAVVYNESGNMTLGAASQLGAPFTGSLNDGSKDTDTCTDWSATGVLTTNTGDTASTTDWFFNATTACGASRPLYCLQE